MTTINEAQGAVHELDMWEILHRFLIMGSETGDFYVTQPDLDVQHLQNVCKCWANDPARTLSAIGEISVSRRAPKNDWAIAALAWGFVHPDTNVRRNCEAVMPTVVRTGSHLITFVDYVTRLRGWGRLLKRAVSKWFNDKNPQDLGLQLIKYKNRKGWSQRDILRLAHPYPVDISHDSAYFYAVGGDPFNMKREFANALPKPIEGSLLLWENRDQPSLKSNMDIVSKYGLPWEAVPSEMLQSPMFWLHAYKTVGEEALLKNLGRITSIGLLNATMPFSVGINKRISEIRAHPIKMFIARHQYMQGRGQFTNAEGEARQTWDPQAATISALDAAIFASIKAVKPTNKRVVVAFDISGSMQHSVIPTMSNISTVWTSAIIGVLINQIETYHMALTFNKTAKRAAALENKDYTVDFMYNELRDMITGGTNCAAPIQWCIDNDSTPDAIIVLTDSQHWDGPQPDGPLATLRQKTGVPVKLVTIALTPNKWTSVAPGDPLSLNVVGFDANALDVVLDFIRE